MRRMMLFLLIALLALGGVGASIQATPAPSQLLWRFDGQNSAEKQGTSISSAGIIQTTGAPAVITGLQIAPSGLPGNHISARVYSGDSGVLLHTIPAPAQVYTTSINSVATLGDLTGDGLSEFIVGTPNAIVGDPASGQSVPAGLARLYDASGALLWTFLGQTAYAEFGVSVASAGDINGDALPDILIGAPGEDAVYVYSGNPQSQFALLTALHGTAAGERFGGSVARLGLAPVIGNPPRPEVVVGAPLYPAPGGTGYRGAIYVFAFTPAPFAASQVLLVTGGVDHLLGMSVDGGADLNGDGVPDFLGGAPGSGPSIFGRVNTYSGANGVLLRSFVSAQAGDQFGFSARFAGTCGGVATALAAGAPAAVNPMTSTPTGRIAAFNAVTGALLTQIYGDENGDAFGISVGGYADLTGDSRDEFLVGAFGANIPPSAANAGSAFVYSCTPLPRPAIQVIPNPVDFGSRSLGTLTTIPLRINNTGTGPLQVTSIGLTAVSNPAFTYVGPASFVLNPSTGITVTLQYAPATAAMHGGTLLIQSNDPANPVFSVPVKGQGLQAAIQVTPPVVAFGAVDVGDMAWTYVKARNIGNAVLSVTGIGLSGGSSTDFSLTTVPTLPLTLSPGQQTQFQVAFQPTGAGARNGSIQVASSDPANPLVSVPLSGAGVTHNISPTAIITMETPYTFGSNFMTVHFHGEGSFDPDGTVVAWAWDFGDGGTSSLAHDTHSFGCPAVYTCTYVVRLMVTDNGGKKDPTSVSVLVRPDGPPPPRSPADGEGLSALLPLRSRFWGSIKLNGQSVPEDTVVEAWIQNSGVLTRVASSLVQTHLTQTVYAIEAPPKTEGLGGADGDQVFFRFRGIQADQTGTWYNSTDQRIDLTASFWIIDAISPCVRWPELSICVPRTSLPLHGIRVGLIKVPVPPIPDPGPLRTLGDYFQLQMFDAGSGAPITILPGDYEIRTSYTAQQLQAAGINDAGTLRLNYINSNQWTRAGADVVDRLNQQVKTTLNHASIFALMGEGEGTAPRRIYLPVIVSVRP